jgi:uncharacterized protein YfdQ (DUF2303 family)
MTMTDPVDFKDLQDLMQAYFSAHAVPPGVVVVPNDYKLISTEAFQTNRNRVRGRFRTAIVEDFANYYARNAEADKLAHAPVFIGTNPMAAVAVLDWLTGDDLPGHAQHLAICQPDMLPDWRRLVNAHELKFKQDEFVDWLEDAGSLVTAHDDTGNGMTPSAIINAFRNARITRQSEHAQTLEDARIERSALETIDANASKRSPSKLLFHVVPYEGFSARAILVRVVIRANGNEPVFLLRIIGLDNVLRELASEFVNIVQSAIAQFFHGDDTPAIYVGQLEFQQSRED